jgi:tetratricopeptide (TPR) repeat protein
MKVGKQFGGTGKTNATDWKAQLKNLFSRPLILGLLLAVVTLLVYWPARKFDFLGYDDPLYFTQNVHVLNGLTWRNVGWAFTTGDAANWHPLTWLSLMLDAEIFGNQPAGPHLVNLLFHAANAVLLFVLFRRLTAAIFRSALVAALFALHPLHVESVAWIAERKDLLCAFFVLLALLAYAKSVMRDECRVTRKRRALSLVTRHSSHFYFLALFFFALALMSKPMAVTLPFVLLLLDWWPLGRVASCKLQVTGSNTPTFNFQPSTFNKLLLEKIPFFALSIAASLVTFVVQKNGDAVAALTTFSLAVRIENAFVSYARYIGKTFWPATLANPYPHPGHWPFAVVIFSVLLFAGLCVAAIWCARKFPFVFTGWFWFCGMLVPVIGLVQVGTQAMADRYAYLPVIGLFVIFVWGLAQLAAQKKFPETICLLAALALLAGSAAKTRAQLAYWQNDGALFRHALAVTKNNGTASINLGAWLAKNGQSREALEWYDAALKMSPSDPLVLYDAANALASLGNFDDAIADYRRALQLAPGRPNILNNLGCALLAKDQLPEAITNFEAALKSKPDFAYAHNSLGTALFQQGKFDDAARQFDAALKLAPDNSQFAVNLGDTLLRLGKIPAAAECYQRALQLDPGDSQIADKLNALKH